MEEITLTKQQELNTAPRAIKGINFNGNINRC